MRIRRGAGDHYDDLQLHHWAEDTYSANHLCTVTFLLGRTWRGRLPCSSGYFTLCIRFGLAKHSVCMTSCRRNGLLVCLFVTKFFELLVGKLVGEILGCILRNGGYKSLHFL